MIRTALRTRYKSLILPFFVHKGLITDGRKAINIGSGSIMLPGYWNIDISDGADLILDLEHQLLPFQDASMDVAWFYGYKTAKHKVCQYVYDYETLADLFYVAGFRVVKQMAYGESSLPDVHLIDNRPDQMFFLEAIK